MLSQIRNAVRSFVEDRSRVFSIWPERLEMSVFTTNEQDRVRTLLVGTHGTSFMLGADAAATACGIDPEEAAEALAKAPPYPGRMCPEALPNGAVVLRDDFNGSIDGFHRAIDVLGSTRAEALKTPELAKRRNQRHA